MHEIPIREIRESDLPAFKALRLEALREHPAAFGSAYEDGMREPESTWVERVRKAAEGASQCVFLGDAGGELAGMLGVVRQTGSKTDHAAFVWGVYVRPAYRGRGLGKRLMGHALDWCRARKIRLVRLSVATGNERAVRCYEECGFVGYGTSPEEIRIGDVYYDELLMWRRV